MTSTSALVDDTDDGACTADRVPSTTPWLSWGSPLGDGVREVVAAPVLLATTVATFVVSAVATTVVDVVHSWDVPSMVRDGRYEHAGRSLAAEVTGVGLGAVSLVLVAALLVAVVLRAGAGLLGREVGLAAMLRELRRRWALLLGVALGGLVAALVLVVLVGGVVLLLRVPVFVVPVLLGVVTASVGVVVRVATVGVVAALHGVPVRAARRRLAEVRAFSGVGEMYARARHGAVWPVVVAGGLAWAAHRAAEGTAGWPRYLLVDAAVPLMGAVALSVTAVGLVWAHVRATSMAERRLLEPLAWAGVDRVAAAPARPVDDEPGEWRQGPGERGRRARAWGLVLVGACALPGVVAAPVELGLSPAAQVRTVAVDEFLQRPVVAGTSDGLVAIEGFNAMVPHLCSEEGCRDGLFREPVARSYGNLDARAMATDPTGTQAALLATEPIAEGYDELLLLTCAPADCGDGARRTAEVPLRPEGVHWLAVPPAVAVRDGVVAAAYAGWLGDRVELVVMTCPAAACDDPRAVVLGPEPLDGLVRVEIAPDGAVWVLWSHGAVVRLAVVEPGAQEAREVRVLRFGTEEDELHHEEGEVLHPRVVDLAVRDDGAPVVLYRDPGPDRLELLVCDDAACGTDATSPVPGGPYFGAEVVVDRTGRPLVATYGAEVLLHACDDLTCTGARTALLSTQWFPRYDRLLGDFEPFLVLDGQDRPALLLTDPGWIPHPFAVLCVEPRCGL